MYSVDWLNRIRSEELATVAEWLVPPLRILEIGAGTGAQARSLASAGFDVTSLDLPGSSYARDRVYPVREYDGKTLPFPDGAFQMIYSSNVLEHVIDLPSMMAECRRVLSPRGGCIHVLPTSAWRFWTTAAHFPALVPSAPRLSADAWRQCQAYDPLQRIAKTAATVTASLMDTFLPSRHGERGDCMSEISLFSHQAWRKCFESNGFYVRRWRPLGLFYTGYGVLGANVPISVRRRMSRLFGSACNVYELYRVGDKTFCTRTK